METLGFFVMTAAQFLRTSAYGVLCGIAVVSFVVPLWGIDPWIIGSTALGVFLLYVVVSSAYRRAVLFVLFFLLGTFRFQSALPKASIGQQNGEGIVIDVRPSRFGAEDLVMQGQSGLLLLQSVRGTFVYGDAVNVSCIPHLIQDMRGGSLDFSSAARGAFFVCDTSRITLIDHDRGNAIVHMLYQLRDGMRRQARRYLPEPMASLFSGIILGIDETIPYSLKQAFVTTGLVHMLVVSGSHMVLMSEYLSWLFLLFGLYPRWRGALTLVVLFLFVASLGFPASALRGFWFACLLVVARMLGRTRVMTTAVVGTGALMVLWNPFLIRDLGFQLSFLATVGVAIVGPRIEELGEHIYVWYRAWRGIPAFPTKRNRGWMREVMIDPLLYFLRQTAFSTLGAIVMTAPIVATTFGQVSLVAPLANLLVVGWMQPLMIIGIIFLLVAWIPPIAFLLASLLVGMLQLIVLIVRGLSMLPYAQVTIARSWMVSVILYTLLFLWIRRYSQKS